LHHSMFLGRDYLGQLLPFVIGTGSGSITFPQFRRCPAVRGSKEHSADVQETTFLG
jgi:hypothetical protein